MSRAFEEQAIRFLRGEENPFDAFVVSDKPADEFPQCHVAEIHGDEYAKICRVIEKYRNPDYATRRRLHDTRLLIVRGVRGSGKTHLMHVLRQRDTQTPDLWVCPHYYDPALPFSEYLLTEFVRSLLSSEESPAAARLRWCGEQIGRRVLGQAVAATSPQEWLEWVRVSQRRQSPATRSRRVRWSDYEALLSALGDPSDPASLAEICLRHALPASAAHALAIRHIQRCEIGTGVAACMRREGLLAICELAFRDDPSRLSVLLEQDFASAGTAIPPARAEVVVSLLQTLAEILAAVRVPILFAFDNMERLLAPKGPVDLPAAQCFFNGLAHLMDQTTGLLLILFVERGLWNEFGPAINSFADHRLRQGVRVQDFGCVWDLELKPPTPDQIQQAVQRRMAPLLARGPKGEPLPPCFPFAAEEVRAIATAEVDVLRTALLRLRDRYDEIILPSGQRELAAVPELGTPAAEAAREDLGSDALQDQWEQAVAVARRRLQASRRTSLAHELHASLGRWLELLLGQEVRGWTLAESRSAVPYGEHPTFGLVTVADWRSCEGSTCRVALGPILGEGRSMPKDMEIKFSVLKQRPSLADQLVLLWPVPQGSIEARQLPPASRQVWEQLAPGYSVRLCPLPLADFAWLLGFPDWLAARATNSNADQRRAFALQRTGYLLEDFAPRLLSEENS